MVITLVYLAFEMGLILREIIVIIYLKCIVH
jgi:hypothetical protein